MLIKPIKPCDITHNIIENMQNNLSIIRRLCYGNNDIMAKSVGFGYRNYSSRLESKKTKLRKAEAIAIIYSLVCMEQPVIRLDYISESINYHEILNNMLLDLIIPSKNTEKLVSACLKRKIFTDRIVTKPVMEDIPTIIMIYKEVYGHASECSKTDIQRSSSLGVI